MLLKIINKLIIFFGFLFLAACSSPEEQALDSQSRGIELYKQGEYAKAELELKSAIQQNASGVGEAYYYLGLLNERSRNYKSMKENLTEAIELNPENLDARLRLGKALLVFDETDEALAQVKEILDRDTGNLDALTLQASIFVKQNKTADAIPILDNVLKQAPDHVEAASLRAVLFMEDQNYDEALSLIEPALESDKTNISLHLLKIKIDAKNKNIDGVIADYKNLISIFPKKDQLKYALAKIYTAANKTTEAEQVLTDMVAAQPDDIKPKLAYLSFVFETDRSRIDDVLQRFIEDNRSNPQQLIELAKWTLMVNRVDDAIQQLKNVGRNEDFKPEVRTEADLLVAKINFQRQNYDESSRQVEQILARNPNYTGAKILKAKMLVREEKLEQASALLNTVLWDVPNSDEAIVLLGGIDMLQGALDKAQKRFKEALEINPANLQALFPVVEKAIKDNYLDYAQQLLEGALARRPNEFSIMNRLVQLKMLNKDWPGAEKIIEAMETRPKTLYIGKFLRGKLHQEQGECKSAIALFEEVLKRYPMQFDSLQEMARCYEILKQRPKMINYLDNTIKAHPDNTAAIVLKSKLLTLDKQYDSAVAMLKQAVKKTPEAVPFYSELARIHLQRGQVGEAIKAYTQGLEYNDGNIELLMLLASAYIDGKQYDEAASVYRRILEHNPRLDIARNNLASLLLDHYGRKEDIDNAVSLVNVFQNSDQPYFLDTYAWAEFKAGRSNQALNALQKVIVMAPEIPVFRYHLAEVYYALGNQSSALTELMQALELAKTSRFEKLDEAKRLMEKVSGGAKNPL